MTTLTGKEMMEMPFEVYDLDATYDAEVAPLVQALMEKCKELRMPCFVAASYSQEADGTTGLVCSAQLMEPARTPLALMACEAITDQRTEHAVNLMRLGAMRTRHAAERLKSAH